MGWGRVSRSLEVKSRSMVWLGRVWERVKGPQQHNNPWCIALHVSHIIESKPHRTGGAERDEETLKASWNIAMS